MKSFLLLCLVAVVCAVPDTPQSFEADVTVKVNSLPGIKGHMYYDYEAQYQRIDQKMFGQSRIEIDSYNTSTKWLMETVAGKTQCATCFLQPPLYPMFIPPFCVLTGRETVNGITCDVWSGTFGIEPYALNMVFWVTTSDPIYVVKAKFSQEITYLDITFTFENLAAYKIPVGVWKTNFTCPAPICVAPVDVVMLIDGSGSISAPNFEVMRTFAIQVVDTYKMGAEYTHIGAIQFASTTTTVSQITPDNETIIAAVSKMAQLKSGTNMQLGLQAAQSEFAARGRSTSAHVLVMFTDGQATEGSDPVPVAETLKTAGIQIFTVGVGSGVDQVQLQKIASQPAATHAFLADTFVDLSKVLNSLVSNTCSGEDCTLDN